MDALLESFLQQKRFFFKLEMMTEQLILSKLQQLPEHLKQEVLDFIGYLAQKQEVKFTQQIEAVSDRKAGSMAGLVTYMAADFDEPLEDFKEYMYKDNELSD